MLWFSANEIFQSLILAVPIFFIVTTRQYPPCQEDEVFHVTLRDHRVRVISRRELAVEVFEFVVLVFVAVVVVLWVVALWVLAVCDCVVLVEVPLGWDVVVLWVLVDDCVVVEVAELGPKVFIPAMSVRLVGRSDHFAQNPSSILFHRLIRRFQSRGVTS